MSSEASTAAADRPLPNVPLIDRPATSGAAGIARPPLAERKRLLIVDDEAPIVKLVGRILAQDNYELRTAESGPAAIRLIDAPGAEPVDLLVTDLMMPDMTGRELAAIVRKKFPTVRVLYQTGFAETLFVGVQELGDGEAFIEKPYSAVGLLEATRLLMFGHIADNQVPPDKRDDEAEWKDERLRAKLVRLLKRLRFA
jgi:CheY-like chemotaxis protein